MNNVLNRMSLETHFLEADFVEGKGNPLSAFELFKLKRAFIQLLCLLVVITDIIE